MVKGRSTLPGKGTTVLSEVSLTIETFVEGVEETPVEDLVEAFKELKLVLEDDCIWLVEVRRNLHHNRLLLQLPEGIENTIRDNHDIGLILIRVSLLHLSLIVGCLMHVAQHF